MKRVTHIFVALLWLCTGTLWAEVYTIDFNRGTVSGMNIDTPVTGVQPSQFCSEGADLFTLHTSTIKSYYDANGCGIRIAAGNGMGKFILTLPEKKNIAKVIVYASKINANSALEFFAADVPLKTFENAELMEYSAVNPASESYQLPDIIINGEYKNLKFQAGSGNCVVLHRVDIYLAGDDSVDAITAPVISTDGMDVFFNLAGQRVRKVSYGIFIKGGKKYVAR